MIDKFLLKSLKNPKQYFLHLLIKILPLCLLTCSHAIILAYTIYLGFIKQQAFSTLYIYIIYLLAIFTINVLYQFYFDKSNRKIASLSKRYWRQTLALYIKGHYRTLDDEQTAGYFTTLASEGVESTDAYYSEFLPQFITVIVNTLLLLGISFYFDWISGTIMLFTAPLIPVFMILIGKTAQGFSLKQWDELKRMNGHLLDLLRGLLVLRSYNLDQQQAHAVENTSNAYRNKTLSVLKISFLSAFTLELTATLSTALIAVSLGVRLLYGKILFFPALCVLLLAPEYFMPLRQLGLKYHAAMNAQSFSTQLKGISGLFDDFEQAESKIAASPKYTFSVRPKTLRFKGLSYAYNESNQVFDHADLCLSLNLPIALIGESGSGKTTLLKLISTDLTPQQGEIYLDDTPLSTYTTEEIYHIFSVVPQKPVIFNLSILDNLRFGNPLASEADVAKACQLCNFSTVINRFPNGLSTIIGEGSQSLSGGEAQLLSLTRAYLRNTPVILLDEPTSALDPLSEQSFAIALKTISLERSLLIAAHRKATIQLCPIKLLVKGGQLSELHDTTKNLEAR